ncbi:MAG: hypothetical protein RLZZ136_1006 [Pseudomonadota bacterium]
MKGVDFCGNRVTIVTSYYLYSGPQQEAEIIIMIYELEQVLLRCLEMADDQQLMLTAAHIASALDALRAEGSVGAHTSVLEPASNPSSVAEDVEF